MRAACPHGSPYRDTAPIRSVGGKYLRGIEVMTQRLLRTGGTLPQRPEGCQREAHRVWAFFEPGNQTRATVSDEGGLLYADIAFDEGARIDVDLHGAVGIIGPSR